MVGGAITKSPSALIGVAIDKGEAGEGDFAASIVRLANQTAARVQRADEFRKDDAILKTGYVGEGYGIVGDLEREAIRLTAQHEGILLDPVYTGRAFGALLDLIGKREFGKNDQIIFWHTGGTPALFAYARELAVSSGS